MVYTPKKLVASVHELTAHANIGVADGPHGGLCGLQLHSEERVSMFLHDLHQAIKQNLLALGLDPLLNV